ncbi:MAG TPA: energy transducer TonB [Pyrinomonadaceae bacterium]
MLVQASPHLRGRFEFNQAKESAAWKRYAVESEEFSVEFPVLPAMQTESVGLGKFQTRRERLLAAYADGVVYTVYTYEKKDLNRDYIVRRLAMPDFTQEERIIVDGVSGKSFRYEDDDRIGVTQFFTMNKSVYVFQALGSKLGNPASGIPKFHSSIQFNRKVSGEKVEDGPGEQVDSNQGLAAGNSAIVPNEEVTRRVFVITKPEPHYTERARQGQVKGTVVLRALFSSFGSVTNIAQIKGLPAGLTEKAIESARQIRFVPAVKDGRFVSVWLQLEYNFNLY